MDSLRRHSFIFRQKAEILYSYRMLCILFTWSNESYTATFPKIGIHIQQTWRCKMGQFSCMSWHLNCKLYSIQFNQ